MLENVQKEEGKTGSETYLKGLLAEFETVLHLWAALHLRRGFHEDLSVGYTKNIDFQYFLHEAEILRYYGRRWAKPVFENTQNSTHPAPEGEPIIPDDAWRVPDDWRPPERQAGWPRHAGEIPFEILQELPIPAKKPVGRPKKTDAKK